MNANIPAWPRLMAADLAAAYLQISPSLFERWVRDGRMPASVPNTDARRLWDRRAIDAAVDRLGGSTAPSHAQSEDFQAT